jgi:protein-tyrosine phosphatase
VSASPAGAHAVIDLHTHILPGLDDGAHTIEHAVAMARAAISDGVTAVAATPHVRDDYPTSADEMHAGVEQVRAALRDAAVPLRLLPGGEIAFDRLALLAVEELARFGLGGNPDYLLVEFPYYGWPLGLDDQLRGLLARGVVPVLAHPERNGEVQADPERLRPLVELGALCQVTAASIEGRLGRGARSAGMALLDGGLAHVLASDAHAPHVRGIGLTAALDALRDDALGRWLTADVPAAIVAGEWLPPRPPGKRRRRRFLGG